MMQQFILCLGYFSFHWICFSLADYTKPVTNLKQLENANNHGFWGNYIINSNNTIQLAWDHVHFYHGYELYWWTDVKGKNGKIYIDPTVLERSRFYEVEYFSFTENTENVFVYYFQLEGWLYGRGYGEKSTVLKTLKPYIGQPYPVSNVTQEYNANLTIIDITWRREIGRKYVIVYYPKNECKLTRQIVKMSANKTRIDGLEDIIYKIFVYEVVNHHEEDRLSKLQATFILARPGYIGQPSAVEELLQMNSKSDHSITLRWKTLSDDQTGDGKLLGYKIRVYANSTYLTLNECNDDSFIDKDVLYFYCFVHGLPLAVQLDVCVYGYNEYGDGYESYMKVFVKKSIYTDLPREVEDLMVSSTSRDNTSIKVQWQKLTASNTGIFSLKSYKVLLSSNGDVKREKNVDIAPYISHLAYPIVERYIEITFPSLDGNRLYNITVCVMTRRMGCGPPSHLFNVNPGYFLNMTPLKIISLDQLPELRFDYLKLRWKIEKDEALLPLVGFVFEFRCHLNWPYKCHSKHFDVPMKDLTRAGNRTLFERSINFHCCGHSTPATGTVVFVKYQTYNQYKFSEWSNVFSVRTRFKNLSQPRDLTLERCKDRAILTWSQIPEDHDGYCVNYRSLRYGIWHSCCIPSSDRMFSYDYHRKTVRFEIGIVENKWDISAVRYKCSPPFGNEKLQFRVAAYNKYGTGYYKQTSFERCGVTKSTVQQQKGTRKTHFSSLTLTIVLVSCFVLFSFCLITWRIKRRLAVRAEINTVTARIFQAGQQASDGQEDEEPNEQWDLMKPLRLPSYRETMERFNTDPPSYDDEPLENEAPVYSQQAEQTV